MGVRHPFFLCINKPIFSRKNLQIVLFFQSSYCCQALYFNLFTFCLKKCQLHSGSEQSQVDRGCTEETLTNTNCWTRAPLGNWNNPKTVFVPGWNSSSFYYQWRFQFLFLFIKCGLIPHIGIVCYCIDVTLLRSYVDVLFFCLYTLNPIMFKIMPMKFYEFQSQK